MSLGKKATLNNGLEIPLLGYGTWQSKPGEVSAGVYEALKAGYRHLDLAKIYGNQREVGEGLKRAFAEIPGLKREDIWITSKLWNTQHRPEVVEPALDDCLNELGLDYLDLYLIHWPVAFKKGDSHFPLVPGKNEPDGDVEIDDDVTLVDTWKAMIKLLDTGKARTIGVSNFAIEHIKGIVEATGVWPSVNQIERHPLLQSDELITFAKEHNILITAYSAFGNNVIGLPLLVTRPEVKAVAESASKRIGSTVTPAQVILSWSQHGGHSVIPKSVTPSRIRENFQEVDLTPEELQQITDLGKTPKRFNIPYIANKPRWNINVFNEPEEQRTEHQVRIV